MKSRTASLRRTFLPLPSLEKAGDRERGLLQWLCCPPTPQRPGLPEGAQVCDDNHPGHKWLRQIEHPLLPPVGLLRGSSSWHIPNIPHPTVASYDSLERHSAGGWDPCTYWVPRGGLQQGVQLGKITSSSLLLETRSRAK